MSFLMIALPFLHEWRLTFIFNSAHSHLMRASKKLSLKALHI